MAEKRGVIWTVKFLSYAGIVGWASHYQVEMKGETEDITVGLTLNAQDAKDYSTEDFKWKAGDWSNKFPTKREAEEAALAVFKHIAGPDDVMFTDTSGRLIACKDGERAFALERCYQDDDYEAAAEIEKTFREHQRDTRFGHGAPPSVRKKMEVIVERLPEMSDDGDTFRVVDKHGRQ